MNPIIVNCMDVSAPADVDPLVSIADGTSGESFDSCYILATKSEFLEAMASEDNAPIRDRLLIRLKCPFVKIIFYCNSSSEYQLLEITPSGVELRERSFDVKSIASKDLERLLNKHSCESIIKGGKQYHFATPSHNHTNVFFRLGDSIKNRDDLDRVAFWLLQCIDRSDYIFIDSWSIAAVPLRALQILSKKTHFDALPAHPAKQVVDCKKIFYRKTNDLKNSSTPLLLVSVVSSGSLVEKFQEIFCQAFPEKNLSVAAIYSFNEKEYSVCNINLGVVNHKFDDCPLCKEGSTAVEIHPSAYYIKAPRDSGVTLSRTIAGKNYDFFNRYASHLNDFIIFHKGDEIKGNKHYPYYLDYKVISRLEEFNNRLKHTLADKVVEKTLMLSFVDDIQLREIASNQGFSFEVLNNANEILNQDILDKVSSSNKIIIYDSVVIHGARLSTVNNLIRETASLSSSIKNILFLIGIYRPSKISAESQLRNSLAYKDSLVNRELLHIESLILPDTGTNTCSWCLELNAIKSSIKQSLRGSGVFFDRMQKLSNLNEGVRGHDAFFHVDSRTDGLVLGSGSYLAPENTCIAGVVLAVASGLQQMRDDTDEKKRLAPGFPYTQAVASNNFTNYSEGIIRAALVRNTSANELGILEKEKTMKTLLSSLEDHNQASVLSEYLIAILCGKFPPLPTLTKEIRILLDGLFVESPEIMQLTEN